MIIQIVAFQAMESNPLRTVRLIFVFFLHLFAFFVVVLSEKSTHFSPNLPSINLGQIST